MVLHHNNLYYLKVREKFKIDETPKRVKCLDIIVPHNTGVVSCTLQLYNYTCYVISTLSCASLLTFLLSTSI